MTPWTVAHQASLSMGFSRQEYWSGFPSPSPGDLPNPGIKPASLLRHLLHWQADSLPLCHLGNLLQEWTFLPSVALGVAYHGNADSVENNFVCKAKPDLTLTLSSPDFWFLSKGQIVISYRHYGKKKNKTFRSQVWIWDIYYGSVISGFLLILTSFLTNLNISLFPELAKDFLSLGLLCLCMRVNMCACLYV